MKKTETISSIVREFTDFRGEKHKFVVAAVSTLMDELCEEDYDCVIELYPDVVKYVSVGVSICNPEDEFDEELGKLKAIKRARNSDTIMYVTKPGMISTKVVDALLEQEANYIINNPGQYIKGYSASEIKFNKKKLKEDQISQLSEAEKSALELLRNSDIRKKLEALI